MSTRSSRRLRMEHYVPYQLALIGQNEACTASDLVERSVMDAVAVHRAVKRLESLGHVCREESAHDLRVRRLSLTAQERKVYRTIIPYAIELEGRLLGGLAPAKARQFRELLRQLAEQSADLELPDQEP